MCLDLVPEQVQTLCGCYANSRLCCEPVALTSQIVVKEVAIWSTYCVFWRLYHFYVDTTHYEL